MKRVVLGVSGASGAVLALDCAAALRRAGAEVDLVLSAMAERTLAEEVGPDAHARLCACIRAAIWARPSPRAPARWRG